jgi:NADPH2:quinone reductase
MKAVVLSGPASWSIEEADEPVPGEHEVVLDVAACGLCGTDLHTLAGTNPTVRYPITPGHEFVGTVSAVGRSVDDLAVGDRVAVDPSRSCGVCELCLGGRANICRKKGGYGARYPGGFAQRVAVRRESCVRLPDGLGWRRAVLAEPLACVLHAAERIGPVAGKSALVLGGGTIGLLCATVLQASGATVTVSEPLATRRAIGERLGIPEVIGAIEPGTERRWDVVVDASGVARVIELGVGLVDRGGTLAIMGVADPDDRVQFSPHAVNWQELTIIGSTSINHTFAAAVDFLARTPADLGAIVTTVSALERFGDALDAVRGREALKVLVTPDPTTGVMNG